MRLDPGNHGGAGRQRFPTASEAAGALWTGRVDHLMSNLRMRAVNAAVELAVENDPTADAGADRDIDQASAVTARAPSCFGQGGRVAIVLKSRTQPESILQIANQALPAPSG